ncbi:hypothetical protein EC558_02860 [Helicobacter pylori]|nr:hypothetical protein EC558_02860 [Helicobacter pylori]
MGSVKWEAKSGKRFFKRLCLEISFSWFKVVFLMER